MSIFFHDNYCSLNNRESTQPHFVKTGVKVTFGRLRLTAKRSFVKGAGAGEGAGVGVGSDLFLVYPNNETKPHKVANLTFYDITVTS